MRRSAPAVDPLNWLSAMKPAPPWFPCALARLSLPKGLVDGQSVATHQISDMKFDIKEVLVAGDRVIVRGDVTRTPAGELFGVAHTGKSFRMMVIDIQTIKDGKIAKTYHMENWLSAIGQLRAK
jgi:hypothetical protein